MITLSSVYSLIPYTTLFRSMKQNDPHNLRIPALNLLTQLLPDGHRAGVWTFGQQVNHLIPHGNVDTNWRALARSKRSEEHTSELQSRENLVCRLLLEKKNYT